MEELTSRLRTVRGKRFDTRTLFAMMMTMMILALAVFAHPVAPRAATAACPYRLTDLQKVIALPPHPELPGDPPIVWQPRLALPGYVFVYEATTSQSRLQREPRRSRSPQWPYVSEMSTYQHYSENVLPELEKVLGIRPWSDPLESETPLDRDQTSLPKATPCLPAYGAGIPGNTTRSPQSEPVSVGASQHDFHRSPSCRTSPNLDPALAQVSPPEDADGSSIPPEVSNVSRIVQVVNDDTERPGVSLPSSSITEPSSRTTTGQEEGNGFVNAASPIKCAVASENDGADADSDVDEGENIPFIIKVLESSRQDRMSSPWTDTPLSSDKYYPKRISSIPAKLFARPVSCPGNVPPAAVDPSYAYWYARPKLSEHSDSAIGQLPGRASSSSLSKNEDNVILTRLPSASSGPVLTRSLARRVTAADNFVRSSSTSQSVPTGDNRAPSSSTSQPVTTTDIVPFSSKSKLRNALYNRVRSSSSSSRTAKQVPHKSKSVLGKFWNHITK